MKKIISFLRSKPALFYLIIFLFMIVPALLLFLAADESSQPGMVILLALVALANLSGILF
jgi:hypothetical protein